VRGRCGLAAERTVVVPGAHGYGWAGSSPALTTVQPSLRSCRVLKQPLPGGGVLAFPVRIERRQQLAVDRVVADDHCRAVVAAPADVGQAARADGPSIVCRAQLVACFVFEQAHGQQSPSAGPKRARARR
jgi:hypothetical protein